MLGERGELNENVPEGYLTVVEDALCRLNHHECRRVDMITSETHTWPSRPARPTMGISSVIYQLELYIATCFLVVSYRQISVLRRSGCMGCDVLPSKDLGTS